MAGMFTQQYQIYPRSKMALESAEGADLVKAITLLVEHNRPVY